MLLLLSFATKVIALGVPSIVEIDWLIAEGALFALIAKTKVWKRFSNSKLILEKPVLVMYLP